MNSRAYWALIIYGIFCGIMFKSYEGWMDALSTVLWLGATIYLAYNMEWRAYGRRLTNLEPVVRRVRGKTKVTFRLTYARRDVVADVGFWSVFLVALFFLNWFNWLIPAFLIVIAAVLIIFAFAGVMYVAMRVRPMYNRLVQWFIYYRARFRHHERIRRR